MKDAIASACEKFKNNVATYRRGEQLDILDFQIPGKIEYYLRMVFDHENSHTSAVYISGDLGEAVVYPTCTPTLEGMANCFTCRRQNGTIDINESYFIEKIKTASNIYTFDADDFKADLRQVCKDRFGEDAKECEELEEFIEEEIDDFCAHGVTFSSDGVTIEHDAQERLEEIIPDCEYELYDCGRRVHPRIVLWLVALRLAWEQVKKQGEENDKGK